MKTNIVFKLMSVMALLISIFSLRTFIHIYIVFDAFFERKKIVTSTDGYVLPSDNLSNNRIS